MKVRSAILFIILLILSFNLFAQERDTTDHYYIGLHTHYGFIIPHTAAIEPVSHTNPYGIEVSLNNLKTSFESWSVFNRYNISGFQFSYFNFQNPEVLGRAYVLSMFTEPVLSYGDRLVFSVKGGMGFSYQTKIYNYESNPTNKFFSTRISFPLYLSARLKYRLGEKTYFSLSGTYNHISNGAMRIPNYGMNFPTLTAGVDYFIKPPPKLYKVYSPVGNKKVSANYLFFQVLTGYKVVYGVDTWALGFSTRYICQLRSKYSLNAGAEFILDDGVKKMIEIENLDLDYKRFAITAGQDFLLGKIIFTQYLGVYVYSPYKAKQPIYEKYEFSYRIFPEFLIGIYLKAHTSEADLFGFSANYIFKIR